MVGLWDGLFYWDGDIGGYRMGQAEVATAIQDENDERKRSSRGSNEVGGEIRGCRVADRKTSQVNSEEQSCMMVSTGEVYPAMAGGG